MENRYPETTRVAVVYRKKSASNENSAGLRGGLWMLLRSNEQFPDIDVQYEGNLFEIF